MKSKRLLNPHNIINLLPEAIYWLDKQGIYQGANLSYLHFLQLNSPDELIGKSHHHFNHILDETCIEDIHKNNQQVLTSGKSEIFEEIMVLKNGNKKIFLSHEIPLQSKKGAILGLLASCVDITHLKNERDELKSQIDEAKLTINHIVTNMPGHVYWKNTDGVYLGCNNSQARSLGLHYGREVIGKTDFDLPWKAGIAAKFQENDKRIMQTGIAETVEENAQVNGKEATVISRKTPLKDKNGTVVGILGISIDITDRKKAEQELKVAKEIAETANQAKTEFLRNMRHDLRTPFSGILGAAELLEAEETNPSKKETLGYIVESAQALLGHLNEILEFVEVESGQLPILEKEFDIHALMQNVAKMISPLAKRKQLELIITLDKDLPHNLIGDAVRTQRILMNLIGNAIKFTDKGSIKVHIEGIPQKKFHEIMVRFLIEDTGMGIPEDKQEMIFERFSRLTSSYSGVYPGKGLGLKIVKQFLDEIDGQLHLESTVGKGTTFNILIPYKISFRSEMKKKANQQHGATHTNIIENFSTHEIPEPISSNLGQKKRINLKKSTVAVLNKILLVEDFTIAAKIAKNILLELDCEVDVAENGRTALKLIEENSYDLIFMDIGLPDIDGYKVTQQIRSHEVAQTSRTPIVALTAHAESDEKQHCLAIGMNMIITKPLTKKWAESVLETFIPERKKYNKQVEQTHQEKTTTIKIVDFEYAKALAGGNETVIREMLAMLIESFPAELEEMQSAYEKKDWVALRAIAHKLKGGSSYCGTLLLKSACTKLDNYIKSGSTEKIPKLYQKMVAEIWAIQKFMNDHSLD